jgi:Sodium:dicarboxylate symporter family
MVLTAYNTVFGTTGIPDGFEFIVAIDWFLDRLQTVVNVSGDTIVAATIAHIVKLDDDDEILKAADPDASNRTKHVFSDDGSDDVEEIMNVDYVPAFKDNIMPDFSV